MTNVSKDTVQDWAMQFPPAVITRAALTASSLAPWWIRTQKSGTLCAKTLRTYNVNFTSRYDRTLLLTMLALCIEAQEEEKARRGDNGRASSPSSSGMN